MEFLLSEDHRMMDDAVRRVLADACPPEALRKTAGGFDAARWAQVVDLGILGVLVPEEQGGLELDALTLALLATACGTYAVPEPVAECAGVTAPLLSALAAGGSDTAAQWLAALVQGAARIALVPGAGEPAALAEGADAFLMADADGWRLRRPDEVVLTAAPGLGDTRAAFLVRAVGEGVPLGTLEDAAAARIGVLTDLVIAAELHGLTKAMLDMAVEYAGVRQQFGRPIGTFQAVQHQLADVFVKHEFAHPVLLRAAWAVAEAPDMAPVYAAHARIAAAEAALEAGKAAIQVHGAMGYTFEADLHFWMKRAWHLAEARGGRIASERRLFDHLLGQPAAQTPDKFHPAGGLSQP